jgi:DNA-binding NarL/FixJ family response regulator
MQNQEQIKIIIVDDHEIFRGGLKMMINRFKNFKVIAEASGGKEFLEIIKNGLPDIVIMDIQMPEMNGIETTEKALKIYPDLKIVALSMFNEDNYVDSMINSGVRGFLLKNINREKLEKALETIHKGGNYYSEELWEFFTRRIVQNEKPAEDNVKLTKREIEILDMIAKGMGNKEIADKLFLSERTVIGHKSNILAKTNCDNTLKLLLYAVKNKLVDF